MPDNDGDKNGRHIDEINKSVTWQKPGDGVESRDTDALSGGKPAKKRSAAKNKQFMSDSVGAKGCLALIIVIIGIGILVYIVSTFAPSFSSLPRFIWFSENALEIEWPFGNRGKNTGDNEKRDTSQNETGRQPQQDSRDSEPTDETGESGAGESGAGESVDGAPESERNPAIVNNNDDTRADSASDSALVSEFASTDEFTLEAQAWQEYAAFYAKHNELIKAINDFSDGAIKTDELRVVCEDINNFFNDAIKMLNYTRNDISRENIDLLMAAAMSDQIAAASVIKHLDGDIAAELDNLASDYNRNAGDAEEAYRVFTERNSEE